MEGINKVLEISDLAELVIELFKRGATFSVSKRGDGYWHVELEGF